MLIQYQKSLEGLTLGLFSDPFGIPKILVHDGAPDQVVPKTHIQSLV